jgi:RNA polymerase sigma factor (TIGR02999 family)
MRDILRNHARDWSAQKRGGEWEKVPLDEQFAIGEDRVLDLVALDQGLENLEKRDPRLAEIVEMRLLGGMTAAEIAEVRGVSSRTVERDSKMTTMFLLQQMDAGDGSE